MILEKAKQLQIKHVIQITVCVLGVYLLRNKQAYQFVPSWRKDADLAHYGNNQFPSLDERLPTPVVSDVDGNGEMDIVFVTNDGRLQITTFRKSDTISKRLPHLEVIYSCNIREGNDNFDVEKRPVILETGYLDEPQNNKERTQVIVIMYSNWRVQCYDHRLQLLWQRTLLDVGASLSQHTVHSMAVMITPYKLHPTDRGLIIVGASLTHKGHAHSIIDDDEDNETVEPVDAAGDGDDDDEDDNFESSAFSRFSTFALSGLNGTLKWQHLPHVMNKATEMEEEIHHWKLSLHRGSWSHSDKHWSKYGRYLFRHMPHQWHHTKDTKFDLADLHQIQDDRKGGSLAASASPLEDLGTSHLIGLAFGGLRPHSRHEHVNNPSAVVVHNDKGLELLSLFNGKFITGLALEQHTAVYGDINSDGKLDQVLVKLADVCQGEASTVHPRPKTLFVVDICSTGWWSDQDNSNTENKHINVPPIIVRSVSRPHGLVNHLLGKALPTERKGFDSIFITSSGFVSSFDPFGNKNWQVQTRIKWSDKIKSAENPKYRYTPEGRVLYNAFTPSMLPLALQIYGPETHAIISGWNNIILVDLEDGYVTAEHSLPCPPLEAPVLADFDGDGWTDVIIYCPNGYVGMSIHTQPQYVYMTVLSVTIVLLMLLLSWCSQVD